MRRSLLLLTSFLASALFLGCGRPASVTGPVDDGPSFIAAETRTLVFVFPLEFTGFGLCTGEEVNWTGELKVVDHITANQGFPLNPDGPWQHSIFNRQLRLTGIGVESGDTYTLRSAINESLQSPKPDSENPTAFTTLSREKIFGPSGGLLGFGLFSAKLVLNGAGDLVLEDFDFSEVCH
jgi:hypothetical protein